MTQGGRGSSLLRLSSIPPAGRPSAERVRAMAASSELQIQLSKKFSQRPLMSVWEGQSKDGKRVALTVVDGSGTPTEQTRVLRAAHALMRLGPVTSVLSIQAVSDEAHAFVSDLWTTGTAADLSVLRWPMARKLDFGRRVCAALVTLHEAKIVHGCLCPENILLDDELGPVITEARMVSIAESLEGDRENFFGYGAFAAPEAAGTGAIDVRSDVFSLGRLLMFLVLDREPGDGDLSELAEKVPGLLPIVRTATQAAAPSRQPTMAELLRELDRCLRQLAPEEQVPTAARRPGATNVASAEPTAQAATLVRRTSPGLKPVGPATAPTAATRAPSARVPPQAAAPSQGSIGLACVGLAVLAAPVAASYLLRALSSEVEIGLQAVAAVGAVVVAASLPVRALLRVVLALMAAALVVAINPVGRARTRRDLRALRSADAAERARAVRPLVVAGYKDLASAQIAGANLSGLDLSNANLDHANLTGAVLISAKLVSARLDGAALLASQLQGANLTGASVAGVTGFEAASCDKATVLPAGWHCDLAHAVVAPGDSR